MIVNTIGPFISRYFFRMIPEGSCKIFIRKKLLLSRGHLPKEVQVNTGDVVVLVGTPNIRTIARAISCIGMNGKLIIIEADEKSVNKLSDWVKKNDKKNVEIVHKAVWSEKKELGFLKASKPGDNRLENEKIMSDNDRAGYTDKVFVSADTIDNILKERNVSYVDFMEITINGAEFEAVKGARSSLLNTKRVFVKGHCRDAETNVPINVAIKEFLDHLNFNTLLSRKTQAVHDEWGAREGDVFAYRT